MGGLESARADAMRQNTVFDLVGPRRRVDLTVGPFAKWGVPAAGAAVAAGCTYLDSTGEPEFIRRVFEELDGPAEVGRAADYVAWLRVRAGVVRGRAGAGAAGDDAMRVDVGYYALGGGPNSLSAGTRESLVGIVARRQPRVPRRRRAPVRSAERVRSFTVAGQGARGVLLGWRGALRAAGAFDRARGQRVHRVVRAAVAGAAGGVRGGLGGAARAAGAADDEVLGRAGGVGSGAPRSAGRRRRCGRGSRRRRMDVSGTCWRRCTSPARTGTTSPRRSWPGRCGSGVEARVCWGR